MHNRTTYYLLAREALQSHIDSLADVASEAIYREAERDYLTVLRDNDAIAPPTVPMLPPALQVPAEPVGLPPTQILPRSSPSSLGLLPAPSTGGPPVNGPTIVIQPVFALLPYDGGQDARVARPSASALPVESITSTRVKKAPWRRWSRRALAACALGLLATVGYLALVVIQDPTNPPASFAYRELGSVPAAQHWLATQQPQVGWSITTTSATRQEWNWVNGRWARQTDVVQVGSVPYCHVFTADRAHCATAG